MDLLEQEINKNKKTSSSKKNIVLVLLIICIFALIMLLVMITALKGKEPVKDRLLVNGVENNLEEGLIISDEKGTKYISLEKGAELAGYKYFNGEYGKNEEDKDKCYFQNDYEAIDFQVNTNKIYKIELKTNIGRQEFELANKIIKNSENGLYATLEDFSKACNVGIKISEDGKQIEINTLDYLAQLYKKSLENNDKYKSIDDKYENLKAIYYGMLVVSDGTNYGVVDENLKTIIGTKYKSIVFNDYTKEFIGLSNNKYGILSSEGKVKVEFKYDSINIINYSPLFYEVKQNNKYGVLDKNGDIIIDIEYDKLGYNSNTEDGLLLIIKDIKNKEDGMIVYKDGKYGIVSINTGEMILNCELEKIYTKTSDNDQKVYYVQVQGNEYELEDYIKYLNTTIVNLTND